MTVSAPEPTKAQQLVVKAPQETKTLVTAGAGAGKTFTLVRRIEHLVLGGLRASELLVLTFSRAATAELRERLRAAGEATAHVRVSTFDAWALQILRESASDEAWAGRTFEERITAAVVRLADPGSAPESLEDVLHVVIDEVQDLVGARRELVQTFLDAYECGFTVVGDLAQAVYGFQVADPEARGTEAGRFMSWLREHFEGELVEFTLDRNFRAETEEAACALKHATQVRQASTAAEGRAALEVLQLELAERLEFGDLSVPYVARALGSDLGSTAILCKTNGQAMLISRWLADLDLSHRVRRGADERNAPAWVAGVVRGFGSAPVVTKRDFLSAWRESQSSQTRESGDRAWDQLWRAAGGGTGGSVVLERLRTAVAQGSVADDLDAQDPSPLVVSTFHRAKGLEFDRVLIVEPGPPTERPGQREAALGDEARALYVAMTRARQELYRLAPPDAFRTRTRGFALVRKVDGTDRWGRYGYQKYQRLGLSAIAGDVHHPHPAGIQQIDCDPVKIQKYLAERVTPGDAVEWSRADGVACDHDQRLSPGYALRHEDREIGIASEKFRRDLYRFMKRNPKDKPTHWPRTVGELRIDVVETVAGEGSAASLAGLGPHGLWLAPRPFGLSRFTYDPTETQEKDA